MQRYDLLNLDQLAEQEEQQKISSERNVVSHHSAEEFLDHQQNSQCCERLQSEEVSPSANHMKDPFPLKNHIPINPSANVLMLDDFGFVGYDDHIDEIENYQEKTNSISEVKLEIQDEQSFDFSSFWDSTDIFRDGMLKIEECDEDTVVEPSSTSISAVQSNMDLFPKRLMANFTTIPQPLNFFDDVNINLEDDPILKKVAENKFNQSLHAAQFFSAPTPVDPPSNTHSLSSNLSADFVRDSRSKVSVLTACSNFVKFFSFQLSVVSQQWQLFANVLHSRTSPPLIVLREFFQLIWLLVRASGVILIHFFLFFFQVIFKCTGIQIDIVSVFSLLESLSLFIYTDHIYSMRYLEVLPMRFAVLLILPIS